jgi:hypothetical protein
MEEKILKIIENTNLTSEQKVQDIMILIKMENVYCYEMGWSASKDSFDAAYNSVIKKLHETKKNIK